MFSLHNHDKHLGKTTKLEIQHYALLVMLGHLIQVGSFQ